LKEAGLGKENRLRFSGTTQSHPPIGTVLRETNNKTPGATLREKMSGVARSKLGIETDMNWFCPIKSHSKVTGSFATLAVFIGLMQPCLGGDSATAATDESNAAKNLARMNCGAKIDWITPDGRVAAVLNASDNNASATALLMDDDTLSCPLKEGETTFIITFPKTSQLDRFTFLNENAAAEGEMKIAVSNYRLAPESPKWTEVTGSVAFSRKRLFNLSLVGVEARYVKLSFHVEKGGRIAALGLYGEESLQTFADRQRGMIRVANKIATRRLEDMLNFNFANLYARARVVYVSSGLQETARRMIDDDTITAFQFAASDPHPTAIVELAETERIHRVSALYKMLPGRLDVYLLRELGANPGDLRNAKPIASVTDEKAGGKAAVDFDPQGARYVGLRWTPLEPGGRRVSFEVAEIHAFGDMPLSMLNAYAYALPGVYASISPAISVPAPPVEIPVLPFVSE
jgi:hypothetical protein